MVSGNTVMKRDFILFTVEESRLAPTELVHLFRECILSKNLLSVAVSLKGDVINITKTHGTN